jgi:hypothetical protein
MAIDSGKPETDSPPPPPPPRPEYGSHEDAFDETAQPEPDDEELSGFVVPRAANDDVAGAKYAQSEGTPVIGRLGDTEVAGEWEGHTVIDLRANPNANEVWAEAHERGDLRPDGRPITEPGWSPELNEDWIGSIVEKGAIVYLGSEPAGDNLVSSNHQYPSVFSTEIDQLQDAGYQRVGEYMVPEKLAQAFAERDQPPIDEE